MKYNHTQIGYLIIFALLVTITIFTNLLLKNEYQTYITVIMLMIILLLTSFLYLNVKIEDDYLKIKFGWGIYKKQFFLKDIISVKTVKHHWYCGWGIRVCFWPTKSIIYNISGFDLVEIKLKNNKKYKIGTDDAENLKNIILKSI